MKKRKLIYFLSAFVLIIGCYALNLSYSLFTATASSENNVVDSTIPILNASLKEDTFTIPANGTKVVKLIINNSSNVNMRYGISIEDTKGTTIQLVEGYSITGEIASETKEKEVWFYVTNPTEVEIIDLTFKLDVKYNTLIFNESEFLSASNFKKKDDGTLDTVKLLNSSILVRAMDTTIIDEEKTIYDNSFDFNNITGISEKNERKLIKSEDDYGTSYVFRGNVIDNYVNFAGFTWRIVRINGNGSVRLILDGLLNKVNIPGTETKVHSSTTVFNSPSNKNAHIGYMYGTPGSETYQEEHEFTGDKTTYTPGTATSGHSTIKVALDKFYDTYLKTYGSYIADTLFCGDKTLADKDGTDDNIGGVETQLGTGTNKTYYAATERLLYSSGTKSIATAKPTLMCAENANEDYSRYSVSVQTLKSGKTTNGDLTYPVALLSADELVMAGAFNSKSNINYYLYNADTVGTTNWWTMTPSYLSGSFARVFYSINSYSLFNGSGSLSNGVRPVINLNPDLLIESGDGTKEITYDEQGNILTGGPYILK